MSVVSSEFADWLVRYGLTEVFTTVSGDAFYVNKDKRYAVIKRKNQQGVYSFYLDDVLEFRTYDDEKLIAEWNRTTSWHVMERPKGFSTNEVKMRIFLKDSHMVDLQIFKGLRSNISRDSADHVRLFNYACHISQVVYKHILDV